MSVIDPKTVRLRDGAAVDLRSPVEDDAPRLIAYLDTIRHETGFILFSPDDPLPDEAWERAWVRASVEGRGVKIMAEVDDEVVALCDIGCGTHARVRHRGELGISIKQAWCDRGLGTLLMGELVAWAEADEEIEVLSLGVYADNTRAQRVYEKLGFAADGQRRWHVKRDGEHVDEIMMSRWVGVSA